ncbi:DMT family transporter [Halomonas sp. YLB-10]|uniref:DMT family transporter n=1 Tax=unclassified Halomonas TaxID=2609666 RepID=UPI000F5F6568|nr:MULTISPECIES: DMT family transporter [unclassified Halomonas]RQW68673.1 DMT family transporter [Halomonas sp. YLB-10]
MFSGTTLSVTYSLLSSLMFALTFVLVKAGTKNTSSTAALWLTLSINTLVLGFWGLLRIDFHGFQILDWWHFILAGIFAPLLGRFFQFLGMAKLGANITTPLTLTHPLISIMLALLFMGEETTLLGLAGAFLVLTGSIIIGLQSSSVSSSVASTRIVNISLIYPLAASVSYGSSIALRKAGVTSDTDPIIAAAITTITSWLIASLFILPKNKNIFRACDRKDLNILTIAGILSSFGPILLILALKSGNLVIVAPLAATTPLFSLLISYLLIRKDEFFNLWIVFGTFSSFVGICLSTIYGIAQ